MKVVSGGQTGVDRASLDEALSAGLSVGGWCPAGRKAEDGAIDLHYPLSETPSAEYAVRTDWNVRDSDGTLLLLRDQRPVGGSRLTMDCANRRGKPVQVVSLELTGGVEEVVGWIRAHRIETLNIAGPRESEEPGIHAQARSYLRRLFNEIVKDPDG